MELMHHVLGEGMAAMYVVALLLGVTVGVAARLSRGFRQRRTVPDNES
jgi:hypothetical protein